MGGIKILWKNEMPTSLSIQATQFTNDWVFCGKCSLMKFNADNSKERPLVLTVSGQFEGVRHWDSFSLRILRLPDPSLLLFFFS